MQFEMERWGRDHWSVLALVESWCVEGVGGTPGYGKPDFRKIQTNMNRHAGVLSYDPIFGQPEDGAHYGIRLRDGTELAGPEYDEWDCLDDAEREGLIENVGTGFNPVFKMTDRGNMVFGLLRSHKANGGSFGTFDVMPHLEGVQEILVGPDADEPAD